MALLFMPKEVSRIDLAFGPRNLREFMPPDIPQEFSRHNGTKWNQVVCDWFFGGLKNAKWVPKEGIDVDKALAHVRAILGSFEPKHEDKEAACAYLLSLWFESVSYDGAAKNPFAKAKGESA